MEENKQFIQMLDELVKQFNHRFDELSKTQMFILREFKANRKLLEMGIMESNDVKYNKKKSINNNTKKDCNEFRTVVNYFNGMIDKLNLENIINDSNIPYVGRYWSASEFNDCVRKSRDDNKLNYNDITSGEKNKLKKLLYSVIKNKIKEAKQNKNKDSEQYKNWGKSITLLKQDHIEYEKNRKLKIQSNKEKEPEKENETLKDKEYPTELRYDDE